MSFDLSSVLIALALLAYAYVAVWTFQSLGRRRAIIRELASREYYVGHLVGSVVASLTWPVALAVAIPLGILDAVRHIIRSRNRDAD